ncbi:MAG: tetratricopeptide repeat protein [Pseudomonadota bacterium]|nr:tetratricopeptide repeat protein [Pseudomonadota bacterium]
MSLEESIALVRAARYSEAEARLRSLVEAAPMGPEALELLGVAISAQGREAEALPWFERALRARPNLASALHNRARALVGLGRFAEARTDLEAALATQPDMVPALTLLGGVLATQGDPAGAERNYRSAVQLRPDAAEPLFNLGVFLRGAGRLEEAIESYRRALEIQPAFVPARSNLANALRSVGKLEEALEHYALAVRYAPNFADGYSNWGAALREAGRIDEAVPLLERALSLNPDSAGVLTNLGISHFTRHRYEAAIDCYRRALAARPGFHEALSNMGNALAALGRADEAAAAYSAVLAVDSRNAAAYNNLGLLHQERGDHAAALANYEQALVLEPGHAHALSNMGFLLEEGGRREAAMDLYRRALAANPRLARAAYNLAIAHLNRFEFERGWELAESRYDTIPPVTPRRAFPMARFVAADWSRGHRIAIWREQGIGDQLLYATLLPALESRGQDFVVEVDRRLAPALQRAHRSWEICDLEDSANAFSRCDRHLPMGSLPGLLRPSLESFEGQPRALLAADPARAAAFRDRLGSERGGVRVGISWRSFQPKARGKLARRKSAPLEAFSALSRRPGVRLLDLQYGDTQFERDEFKRGGGSLERLEGLDLFNDIDGVLAAIEACDLVVTTSNVTAHLAGGLGKRTLLVYLGAASPFHYWVARADGKCLWYPSVEVVTALELDTWDKALARIDGLLAS